MPVTDIPQPPAITVAVVLPRPEPTDQLSDAEPPTDENLAIEESDTTAVDMTPTVLAPHDTGPATTTIYQELGNDPTPVTAGSEIVSSALSTYEQFDDVLVPVAGTSRRELTEGVERIVGAEGPVLGTRPHSAYVRASGGQRVGKLIATELNKQSRKQFDNGVHCLIQIVDVIRDRKVTFNPDPFLMLPVAQ